MKHDPIRLHPMGCTCSCCDSRPVMSLKPVFVSAFVAAPLVYGLLWAVWTILPN